MSISHGLMSMGSWQRWTSVSAQLSYISVVLVAFFLSVNVVGTKVCLLCALGFWLLAGQYRSYMPYLSNPIVWGSGLLLLLVLIGTLWAPEGIYVWTSAKKYSKVLWILALLPIFMSTDLRSKVFVAWFVAMGLTWGLSILKSLGLVNIGPAYSASWIFHSYITTGFFYAFSAYWLSLNLTKGKATWLGLVYLLVFLGVTIIAVNSGRTGYLAALVLCLVYIMHLKRIGPWLVMSLLLIGLLGAIPYLKELPKQGLSVARHAELAQSPSLDSNTMRLQFVTNSIQLIQDKPLGYGTGSFEQVYYQHYGMPKLWDHKVRTPHNDFLLLGVQLGLFGILALCMWYLLPLFVIQTNPVLMRGLVLSFMAAAMVNSFIYTTVSGHMYVFFLSYFLAEHLKSSRVKHSRD